MALARACYEQSDIVLLDDPLSAVDSHVGSHLVQDCICGILKQRTRILVSHQTQYLAEADWVVVMEAGQISHHGRYAQIRSLLHEHVGHNVVLVLPRSMPLVHGVDAAVMLSLLVCWKRQPVQEKMPHAAGLL